MSKSFRVKAEKAKTETYQLADPRQQMAYRASLAREQRAKLMERRRRQRPVDAHGLEYIEHLMAMGLHAPVRTIREAIGVNAWDSLMLDAMNKRLTKGWGDIQERLRWNEIVSTFRNVPDFRTQYAIQAGEFTEFDQITPGGKYYLAEFTDDRASYSVSRYGKAFALTYEAVANDDMSAFGTIVEKFGRAAARTVDQFVWQTLINDNPTIYDGNSLFDDTNHGNDLGATKPLTHDNLEAALDKFASMTDIDGNAIELTPKYLVVHPSQKYDARRLIETAPGRPGTSNNDKNVHYGELEIILTTRITSTYWYIVADPMDVDWLEMGFYQGRQEPEIFEEAADSGHHFEYDSRRWKARIIFGGAITDYRGIVRANV